ncbi:MAG: AMP-binding protein, partial [Candidatus Aminicenantes bacterium]
MYEENQLDIVLFRSTYLKQKNYWVKKLSPELDTIAILRDREKYPNSIRETGDTGSPTVTGQVEISFYHELSGEILKLGKNSDLSSYILLLSALKALIFRYTASKDIIIISPIYKLKTSKKTINSRLFIRDWVEGDMSFKDLVLKVRSSVLEAYENQDYPYHKLLEYLFPSSSPGEKTHENKPVSHILCGFGNLHRDEDIKKIQARLSFCFSKEEGEIKGIIRYDDQVYRESEMIRVSTHFVNLLTGVCRDINTRISAIVFLTREEKEQLLSGFNNNRLDFSRDKRLPGWIREQVEKTPDAVAIGCEEHQITYRYLDKRTNRLAARLRAYHPREDRTIGILLHRSLLMVVSILAAWKSDSAYIPLDTNSPVQRLKEILADSACPVLLTQRQWVHAQLENAYDGNILLLDETQEQNNHPDKKSMINLDLTITGTSLAYVIYTSGSTGKPKGAMVEHSGMMNHIHAKITDLQITTTSIIAQNASHTFDISVWQFFTALTRGGKTIICPHQLVAEPDHFMARIIDRQVTVLEVVPSYLFHMFEFLDPDLHRFASLNYLLVTGETVKPALVKQWFAAYPQIKMVNAYGPTEAADDITHFIMDKALDMDLIPIGKPLYNLNIYILDEYLNLCPPGVRGEICVSGVGVGRGYLNNTELTAEKFCLRRPGGALFEKTAPPGPPRKNFS